MPGPEPALLEFAAVGRHVREGGRKRLLLDAVRFELHAGRSLGVYGSRRSGKSTLARLAAGLEQPDAGSVRFDGRPMPTAPRRRAALLRTQVALLDAAGAAHGAHQVSALDQVALAAGSAGLSLRQARRRALAVLDRLGVAGVGAEAAALLSPDEHARVLLAGALVHEPRLLIVDEPAPLPSLLERDRFRALMRELAREDGIALLVLSEELSALQGLDALATLSQGELCLAHEQDAGSVVALPRRRRAGGRA